MKKYPKHWMPWALILLLALFSLETLASDRSIPPMPSCNESLQDSSSSLVEAEGKWKEFFLALPINIQKTIKYVDLDPIYKDRMTMVIILDPESRIGNSDPVIVLPISEPRISMERQLLMPEWFHDHLVFTRYE